MPKIHKPDEKTRDTVGALLSFGLTHEQIAAYLDIDAETFKVHYRDEIRTAVVRANFNIAKNLYNKAFVQDDLKAQMFWLRTRGRWKYADRDITEEMEALTNSVKEMKAIIEKEHEREY